MKKKERKNTESEYRDEEEGAKEHRKANMGSKALKKQQKTGKTQCKEIDACLNKNNSKKAYQQVNDLTSKKQRSSTAIRTSLGNILQKNKRFSADGQNIAQNYTTIRVMVTIQYWIAVSTQKTYSQSFVRKLRSQ